ncbi:MAG: hypothetical protein COB59_02240 [Rhodospirillaceae bacterium]|nr:MAG: hypothetical protein COB59_02240 [Rhodospirillaceae bacterium]
MTDANNPSAPTPGASAPAPSVKMSAAENATNMGRSRLSQSLMLEEQSPRGLLRFAAFFIFVFTVIFIIWAANTRISQVVVTSGEVSPFGSVKTIQHLEGGIIEDIRVRDGDLVEKNEIIMVLSPSGVTAERNQLAVRLTALELEAEQLHAISMGNTDVIEQVTGTRNEFLANVQAQLFQAKHKATQAQIQVIEKQITQKMIQRGQAKKKAAAVARQVSLLREQLKIRKNLMDKGLQPKLVYLDSQRELSRVQAQRSEAVDLQRQLTESISELESRKLEINARLPMEAAQSLATVSSEIAELKEVIAQVENRVNRLQIRSPVKGVVQNLRTETVGSVIPGGETIAEIIPSDVELKINARIATDDIGFVFKGQVANVKVQAYDYTRFGHINGSIDRISATTYTDELGNPFYLALISLEQNYVGKNPAINRVVPGMTVISDIRTGERTLMEYLLKPVYLAFSEAFRER